MLISCRCSKAIFLTQFHSVVCLYVCYSYADFVGFNVPPDTQYGISGTILAITLNPKSNELET